MSIDFDGNYKRVFAFPEMVRALAEGYLEGDWAESVHWETFDLRPDGYVSPRPAPRENDLSPQLVQRENDLVCRLARKDGSGLYVHLMLEFQSGLDEGMAVRMNTYTAMFTEQEWRRREKGRRWQVPAVAPVVLYTGKRPWTAPQELAPEWPERLRGMEKYGRPMRYVLVETQTAPELEGREPNLADLMFRLERARNGEEAAAAIGLLGRALKQSGTEELAEALLGWFNNVWVRTRLRDVEVKPVASFKEVPKMLEENFNSWADEWIAKGEERGLAKGEERGLAKGEERGLAKGEVKGRKDLLLRQVRERYGDSTASEIAPTLDAIRSLPTLDDIGVWIVTCGTADALLARIRAL